MNKFLLAFLIVVTAVSAYPSVIIEHNGDVTITRNVNPQPTYTTATYGQSYGGDYFTGFNHGYRAGYLDGRNNKHSRSDACVYYPYESCPRNRYYDEEDEFYYPYTTGYGTSYNPYYDRYPVTANTYYPQYPRYY